MERILFPLQFIQTQKRIKLNEDKEVVLGKTKKKKLSNKTVCTR